MELFRSPDGVLASLQDVGKGGPLPEVAEDVRRRPDGHARVRVVEQLDQPVDGTRTGFLQPRDGQIAGSSTVDLQFGHDLGVAQPARPGAPIHASVLSGFADRVAGQDRLDEVVLSGAEGHIPPAPWDILGQNGTSQP
jgi:hypothetical protein